MSIREAKAWIVSLVVILFVTPIIVIAISRDAERLVGTAAPVGASVLPSAAVHEALRQSCDTVLVAAAIRAADVYRRSTMTEGLSVTLRMQWAALGSVEEAYISRCLEVLR